MTKDLRENSPRPQDPARWGSSCIQTCLRSARRPKRNRKDDVEHPARRTDTSQGRAQEDLHLAGDQQAGASASRDLRPWPRSPTRVAPWRWRVRAPTARPAPLCPPDTGGAGRRGIPDRAAAHLRYRAPRGGRDLPARLAPSGAGRQTGWDHLRQPASAELLPAGGGFVAEHLARLLPAAARQGRRRLGCR